MYQQRKKVSILDITDYFSRNVNLVKGKHSPTKAVATLRKVATVRFNCIINIFSNICVFTLTIN